MQLNRATHLCAMAKTELKASTHPASNSSLCFFPQNENSKQADSASGTDCLLRVTFLLTAHVAPTFPLCQSRSYLSESATSNFKLKLQQEEQVAPHTTTSSMPHSQAFLTASHSLVHINCFTQKIGCDTQCAPSKSQGDDI